ncbi:MAG: hypothetical protein IIC54_12750 [Proteobacteria bacterium]|nr:hypothetical protein [Pseudomonadota bacterium]
MISDPWYKADIGAHNADVQGSLLGMSDDEIAVLGAAGVIRGESRRAAIRR